MLIKALNEYYDILARNDKVCKDGFSRQNITHMIMLRKDGTVSDIITVSYTHLGRATCVMKSFLSLCCGGPSRYVCRVRKNCRRRRLYRIG